MSMADARSPTPQPAALQSERRSATPGVYVSPTGTRLQRHAGCRCDTKCVHAPGHWLS